MAKTNNKRSFESSEGSKQDIRFKIADNAKKYLGDPSYIFTLPGPEMLDVTVFKKHLKDTTIVGVEKNTKSFNKILEKCKKTQGVLVYEETVNEYIDRHQNSRTQHFDVVFLDYLGPLNTERLNEIKYFIDTDNLLHRGKKSLLAITLQKTNRVSRDIPKQIIEYVYGDFELNNEYMENSIDNISGAISVHLSGLNDIDVNLLESFEYKNDGGVQMYFILFLIEK